MERKAWPGLTIRKKGSIRPLPSSFRKKACSRFCRQGAQPGDVLFFVADKNKVVFDALGALRLELAKKLKLIDESKLNFLWVTEFPIFERNEESGS